MKNTKLKTKESTLSRATAALYEIYSGTIHGTMSMTAICKRHRLGSQFTVAIKEMGLVRNDSPNASRPQWRWTAGVPPHPAMAKAALEKYRSINREMAKKYAAPPAPVQPKALPAPARSIECVDLSAQPTNAQIMAKLETIETLMLDVLSSAERGKLRAVK